MTPVVRSPSSVSTPTVYETDPSVADLLLTSIRKGMDVSVYEAVVAAGEGNFSNEQYVGTLENEGVSLASVPRLREQGRRRPRR